jgi:small basic protein (TIGR04137 family)
MNLKNQFGNVFSRPGFSPEKNPKELFMSQHRSLKGASTITAKRNVLKRFERVELLKKRGQWKQGAKVIGLPKTKPDA